MPLKTKKGPNAGFITIHTTAPNVLKSMSSGNVWREPSVLVSETRKCPYIRSNVPSPVRGVGTRGTWADWLSHTSMRRLQAQLQAENQEAKAITQPLLDTEDGFIKDLECFLSHRETLELRKRELLHKRWTECVWMPIQRRVEEHVSHGSRQEAERMRCMFLHYIQYYNAKGFVFLENYDPQEYNPFLQHINTPHYFKVSTPALKDPLFLQSRERMKEKRVVLRCQTGRVYSRRQIEEILQQEQPPAPRSSPQAQARVPPLSQALSEMESSLWRPNRGKSTPFLATADGKCLDPDCWSAMGLRQHNAPDPNHSTPTSTS